MFKKDLYTEVVRVLNLNTQDVLFKGGYLIGLYTTGIPYVVDQTTDSAFDYSRTKVIPVSEEISQETPSVHSADRSDYIFQYQIMFQSSRETAVLTALDEFRTYFFNNKQATIDGYTVGFKINRGDKQSNILLQNGDFFSFYNITIYLTAIKDGYIKKTTDTWGIRLKSVLATTLVVGRSYQIVEAKTTDFTLVGAADNVSGTIFIATGVGIGNGLVIMTKLAVSSPTTYQTLKIDEEIFSTVGGTSYANREDKSKGVVSVTTAGDKIRYFYNSTDLDKIIYSLIMNQNDNHAIWEFKHTFDGMTFEYDAFIRLGARTLKDNSIVILEFDWMEADV